MNAGSLVLALSAAAGLAAVEALAQDSNKPNYQLNSVTRPKPPGGAPGALYRHVDANGKVVYTDRPDAAEEKGHAVAPTNVASPEARRQMYIELQNSNREEQAERNAAARRQAVIRSNEAQEAARKKAEYERAHPEEAPRTIRVVP